MWHIRTEYATIALALATSTGIVRQCGALCAELIIILCYMDRLSRRDSKHQRQALRRRCFREPD